MDSENFDEEGLLKNIQLSELALKISKHTFSWNNQSDPVKKANELMAHAYSHLYKLPTTGLRYFTVYGPWGRPDMAMYIFASRIKNNKSIPVFNNGNMRRDFTYIDDIIAGTRSAIDHNYQFEIFNLGNNKSEDLMGMISLIEKCLGKKAIINFMPKGSALVLRTSIVWG